jgi:hypothetical protein
MQAIFQFSLRSLKRPIERSGPKAAGCPYIVSTTAARGESLASLPIMECSDCHDPDWLNLLADGIATLALFRRCGSLLGQAFDDA